MDKIRFAGMTFYAYHGVFPEENKLGQIYKVDLELGLDLQRAGQSDDLNQTVHYAQCYEVVKKIVEQKQYHLLEAIAEDIASTLLHQFSLLEEVRVKVIKPNPPIPGHYESVGVEIERKRS